MQLSQPRAHELRRLKGGGPVSDRLLRNFRAGKLSLGAIVKGGPNIVEVLAESGFDYVVLDMMHTQYDWNDIAHLCRTCNAVDITSVVRVSANPWSTPDGDPRTAVDSVRALSLGADSVMLTAATVQDAQRCPVIARDWHRRTWTGWWLEQPKETFEKEVQDRLQRETLVMPSIEADEVIRNVHKVLETPNLNSLFLAMSDTARVLGHPFGYEHPDVMAFLKKAGHIAREKGILLGANTGYAYRDVRTIAERIRVLHEHGVMMVMIQLAEFLLGIITRDLVRKVAGELKTTPPPLRRMMPWGQTEVPDDPPPGTRF